MTRKRKGEINKYVQEKEKNFLWYLEETEGRKWQRIVETRIIMKGTIDYSIKKRINKVQLNVTSILNKPTVKSRIGFPSKEFSQIAFN